MKDQDLPTDPRPPAFEMPTEAEQFAAIVKNEMQDIKRQLMEEIKLEFAKLRKELSL